MHGVQPYDRGNDEILTRTRKNCNSLAGADGVPCTYLGRIQFCLICRYITNPGHFNPLNGAHYSFKTISKRHFNANNLCTCRQSPATRPLEMLSKLSPSPPSLSLLFSFSPFPRLSLSLSVHVQVHCTRAIAEVEIARAWEAKRTSSRRRRCSLRWRREKKVLDWLLRSGRARRWYFADG